MTIKQRRTAALPLMTSEEKNRYTLGGCIDERIPDAKIRELVDGEYADAFLLFLGPRVGRYRSDLTADLPPVAEEIAWAETTIKFIIELQTRLQHLPPHLSAEIGLIQWQAQSAPQVTFDQTERLCGELRAMQIVIGRAREAVRPHGGMTGPRRNWARDSLLFDVAKWLEGNGLTSDESARLSRKILVAMDIPAPDRPAQTIEAYAARLNQQKNERSR